MNLGFCIYLSFWICFRLLIYQGSKCAYGCEYTSGCEYASGSEYNTVLIIPEFWIYQVFVCLFLFLIRIHSMKAEQPLGGMVLQEKEAQKD